MDDMEKSYSLAIGCCLNAGVALRRFEGKQAIEELLNAIRLIEDAQRQAEQKHKLARIYPPTATTTSSIDGEF